MRIEPRPPEPRLPGRSAFPHDGHDGTDEMRGEPLQANQAPARLNDSEREALLLNMDVALRVHICF